MTFGCVILAGGRSSRMGTDKALLEMNGKKFILQLMEELDWFEEKLIARGNNPAIASSDWSVIPDIYQERGPIGGLHAALSACSSEALFCATCDMPLLQKEMVQDLCRYLEEDCDAVIAVTADGRVHPLCGIYRKSAAGILEEQIQAGNNRIMAVLDRLRVRYVHLDSRQESQQLFNVNTPENYLELKKIK